MEKFQEAIQKAKRNVKIADHMITMTYPLVNDPKLLLAVMENTFLALTQSVGALLHYERLFKRVPPFHDTYEAKYALFREKAAARYGIDKKYLTLMSDIKSIIVEHKNSPIEFARKDVFVICSDNYRIKSISVEDMKRYIAQTKEFVALIDGIVSKDDRLFR